MLPSQEFFSKQVSNFTPKPDGWRGGGKGLASSGPFPLDLPLLVGM